MNIYNYFYIAYVVAFLMKDYEKSMEDDVCGDTSGMFRRVLVSLLTVSKMLSLPRVPLLNTSILIAKY